MWNDYVEQLTRGWDWPSRTPEGVMKNYHRARKRSEQIRERLKNPVSLKGGGPLQPATIRQLENEEKHLIQEVYCYRKLIKCLVKYNLLPTSKLISGENRMQFVFSLWTMLELPELGRAVYYANRLINCRYDHMTPSTNKEYIQRRSEPGWSPEKKDEQSREDLYDALVNSLNETVQSIKRERQRFLLSGTPWRPAKNNSNITGNKISNAHYEKQINHNDKIFKVHRGGLYKPPEVSTDKADDILSDTFKAWQREQRAKTEHHENA